MLTRRSYPIVGVASVTLVVFACLLIGGWGGPTTTGTVSTLGSLTFSLFAFACATAAAIMTAGGRRRAWAAMAIGLFGWVAGDLLGVYYVLIRQTEPLFPSIADGACLLLPVAVCVAWVLNPPLPRRAGMRALLDAATVASAVFLVLWVTDLSDVFATAEGSTIELAVALACPISDIVMITMALLLLTNTPPAVRRTVGMVAAGLVILALADSASVYLRTHDSNAGPAVVIGWAAGLFVIGTAALMAVTNPRSQVRRGPRRSQLTLWLPYLPLPFAVAFGAVALWPVPHAAPILIAAAVMVSAALIRQLTMIVENRNLVDTVADQALRDPLTGLANRVLFADQLGYAMRLQQRDGRDVAVLSLDLDDFKLVNDNLGHPSGDALLQAVADRLRSIVPAGDTVARLGGDEFAVLIEDGPAEEVANRVVEVFDKPFFLDGEEVYIHPSVGLANAPSPADGLIDADELFKRADLAMYTAKRAGIGGVQTFTFDMRQIDRAEIRTTWAQNGKRRRAPLASIQLLGQLRRAIDDDELTLVYQPKISLCTGGIVGVEALVRWPHPDLGLLTPNQFLPLVRQNGLMGAVTDLVLNQAARDAAAWYEAGQCDLPVAINLFAPSLNDLTLPDRIGAALNRAGLPPTAMSVEITEHLLVSNIRRASTVISELRANGLRIAIDDFGSGYATMSYLRDLSIDELKLDRQFIAPILRSERAAAIVRSVIDLAHALGIACVAEGVEDKATADRLRDYGCDIAQGHYFSRPVAADAILDLCQVGCSSSAIFPITS